MILYICNAKAWVLFLDVSLVWNCPTYRHFALVNKLFRFVFFFFVSLSLVQVVVAILLLLQLYCDTCCFFN